MEASRPREVGCLKNAPSPTPSPSSPNFRIISKQPRYFFAVITAEKVAYQIAFLCLIGRITGDIIQNLFDGCYWKVAFFIMCEGLALVLVYFVFEGKNLIIETPKVDSQIGQDDDLLPPLPS